MDLSAIKFSTFLSNPVLLLIIELFFLFLFVFFYVWNRKTDIGRFDFAKDFIKSVQKKSTDFGINFFKERNPVVLVIACFALVLYNLIAWYIKETLQKTYFELFYEFYSGFVIFYILWTAWLQIDTFLLKKLLLGNLINVSGVIKNFDQKGEDHFLKILIYHNLVNILGLPFLVMLIVTIVFPRPFVVGGLIVTGVGFVQNLINFIKVPARPTVTAKTAKSEKSEKSDMPVSVVRKEK